MTGNQMGTIKKYFAGIGITDSRAYDIIFAELVRIKNDERDDIKQKGSRIKVASKTNKYIAESIISMINKQIEAKNVYKLVKGIEVVVEENTVNPNDIKTIDFSKFDYVQECEKLMKRYDETLISNAKINDFFQNELSKSVNAKNKSSDYEFEIVRKNLMIKELTEQIVEDQHSILNIFRQRRIQKNINVRSQLQQDVERLNESLQNNLISQSLNENKNRKRIMRINERQKALLGIKFVFTRKRDKVEKRIDENGKETYFVEPINQASKNKDREYE